MNTDIRDRHYHEFNSRINKYRSAQTRNLSFQNISPPKMFKNDGTDLNQLNQQNGYTSAMNQTPKPTPGGGRLEQQYD